jgi:photosystem II stability/assembly factor-like uncharacterized protein
MRVSGRVGVSLWALAMASVGGAQDRPSSGTTASLRGVSTGAGGAIVWASGTHGTVLRSDDSGSHWRAGVIAGAATFDLRGIVAVGRDTVYAMVSGADTARIYRTVSGGDQWTLVYDDTRHGAFLDGVAWWDSAHGIALGDPIDGAFVVLRTDDAGMHWRAVDAAALPAARPGEAAFAASNGALAIGDSSAAWFVTGGGPVARIFRTVDRGAHWSAAVLPIAAGTSSAGAFAVAFRDRFHGLVVGGDYAAAPTGPGRDGAPRAAIARTEDGGASWTVADSGQSLPYLSSVLPIGGPAAVATGPLGSWLTRNWGRTWQPLDSVGYNAAARIGARVVVVGPRGTIGLLAPH